MFELHEKQLRQMLATAAELGAKNALREMGVDKSQISKAESYRRYSRRRIDRWLREGKIKPVKSNGSVVFNVSELDAQAQTVELYFKHIQPADQV
jgi:peptidyl-tRNA hydrolase